MMVTVQDNRNVFTVISKEYKTANMGQESQQETSCAAARKEDSS